MVRCLRDILVKDYSPKKKKYASLTQFKQELEEAGVKVLDFTGYSLETKTHTYGIYAGNLRASRKEWLCLSSTADS